MGKQKTLFNTKDLEVERVVISAGDIDKLKFVIEEYDELRENPTGKFGIFHTLECTTDRGPTALNISSKRLVKGLTACLEELRGKQVTITAEGEGFSRHYEIEI